MPSWDDVVAIGNALPEVEGLLLLMCSPEEKEVLNTAGDPAFSTTAHYDGHGSILVDLDRVDPGQLAELVEEAWRLKAPARLRDSR